jgi:hypothetical protein
MKFLAYRILLKKYLLIDLGVLLLLITLPLFMNSNDFISIIRRAFLYSGLITPIICYFEIKNSDQLPFFFNLKTSVFGFFGILFGLKAFASIFSSFYA